MDVSNYTFQFIIFYNIICIIKYSIRILYMIIIIDTLSTQFKVTKLFKLYAEKL